MKILLAILIPAVMLTGCQTKETSARFQAAQSDIQACYTTVAQAQAAQQIPKFKDDRDLLVYLVVQKMTANNPYAHCDDAYIAMIQADQAKVRGILNTTSTLGGIGLGIVGVKVLADGFSGTENVSGDTWNVNSSRINNKATASGGSTISSSGEGLGTGNVFGGRNGQGGNEPRQWMTPETEVGNINTESQSGENAPIEGGDGGLSLLPEE